MSVQRHSASGGKLMCLANVANIWPYISARGNSRKTVGQKIPGAPLEPSCRRGLHLAGKTWRHHAGGLGDSCVHTYANAVVFGQCRRLYTPYAGLQAPFVGLHTP